jgi:hypothetical protein
MSPLPKDPTLAMPTQYLKPPGMATRSPGMSRAGLQGWAITGVPRYPRYKTPIVALEPFIEWVAKAVHSAGGKNKYSHVTAGTIAGSSHDHGALRYDTRPKSGSMIGVGMYLHYKHV